KCGCSGRDVRFIARPRTEPDPSDRKGPKLTSHGLAIRAALMRALDATGKKKAGKPMQRTTNEPLTRREAAWAAEEGRTRAERQNSAGHRALRALQSRPHVKSINLIRPKQRASSSGRSQSTSCSARHPT